MRRLIFYIGLSLLIAVLVAWLVALPGTVTIEAAGYRLQPGLGAAAALVIGFIVVVIALWAILRRILGAPRMLARRAAQMRRQAGVEALSDGFIALEAGNAARARQLARDAMVRLPENAAAQLLEARADLALGDMGAAREHYRGLISNKRTAAAALAGLFEQARTQGRKDAALTFARKAIALNHGVAWAQNAVFDDLTARGEWREALQMTATRTATTKAEKAERRRQQAVLHTAIARELEPTDPAGALEHAMSALKLLPDFVPAALVSARIHAHRGEARKAASLLRRVWRATAHPHIAALYANTQPGASAVERLKKTRELIGTPQNVEAAIVLARAAVEAFEWTTAHNALAPFSSANPTQGVCLLMAEIEEGQNGDQGKAREWLARAIRAPRDPVWVADGITSDEWEPVSPVTGRLDAFEWKVPVTAVGVRTGAEPDGGQPEKAHAAHPAALSNAPAGGVAVS